MCSLKCYCEVWLGKYLMKMQMIYLVGHGDKITVFWKVLSKIREIWKFLSKRSKPVFHRKIQKTAISQLFDKISTQVNDSIYQNIFFFARWRFYQTFRNPDLKEIFHFNLGDFPFIDISKTGFWGTKNPTFYKLLKL